MGIRIDTSVYGVDMTGAQLDLTTARCTAPGCPWAVSLFGVSTERSVQAAALRHEYDEHGSRAFAVALSRASKGRVTRSE